MNGLFLMKTRYLFILHDKNAFRLWVAVVIVAALSACSSKDSDPSADGVTSDVEFDVAVDAGGDAASPPVVQVASPQAGFDYVGAPMPRFICRANVGTGGAGVTPCPPVPEAGLENWEVRRLFEPEPALDLFPPDTGSGVFCLYDWVAPLPADLSVQVALLPTQDAGGDALAVPCEADLPVVVPLSIDRAPDSVQTTVKDLYIVTTDQAGVVQTCPAEADPMGAPVTVAVVDSVPTRPDAPIGRPRLANSLHGTTMSLLIRDFATDSTGACAASILQTLALDLRYDESSSQWRLDIEGGGQIGTPGSVALATWDAIRLWTKTAKNSRLVLNYSIGWSPIAAESLSMVAVTMILQAARQRGALMLAAAGNKVAGPDGDTTEVGPMLPAGFEIGPSGTDCPQQDCDPLTFGVGAVVSDSELLPTSRPKSTPRLVAWGFLGVANPAHLDPNGANSSAGFVPLSGTSVSTAIATAAAAAIWAEDPLLSADQVYQRLVDIGDPMSGISVEVCPGAADCSTTAPRRIQLCRAAVSETDGPCIPEPRVPGTVLAEALAADPFPNQPLGQAGGFELSPICGPNYVLWTGQDPETIDFHCPEKQIIGYESQAYVYPQPGDPGCDTCVLTLDESGQGSVGIMVNSRLKTGLKHPRLWLVDSKTNQKTAFDLGLGTLNPGSRVTVSGLMLGDLNFDQVFLVSTYTGLFGKENVILDVVARK